MDIKEANKLRHGNLLTDKRHIWRVGIDPNFPKVLHFWMSGREYRTVNLRKITTSDKDFLRPLKVK